MANFREVVYEVGDIDENGSTYPLIPSNNNNRICVTIRFVLNRKERILLHTGDANVYERVGNQLQETTSPKITLCPLIKGFSRVNMRKKLHDLGVRKHVDQDKAMKKVEARVKGLLVNDHVSLSGQPADCNKGLNVDLFLTISQVWVYDLYEEQVTFVTVQDQEQDQGLKPVDDSVIRKLKRKRVDETMVGEDEKCSVCLEMLVEKEELMVLPCEHVFHEDCVSKWFKKSHLCPLCRFELPAARKPKISVVD